MPSALDGSLGIGVQSVYGTAVAPTRWYPIQSSQLDPEFVETADTAIMGGGFGMRSSARKRVGYGGSGNVSLEVLTKSMGLLLQHVTGTAAAPTGSGPYTYSMPLAANYGKFLTVQEGVPDATATRPLSMVGGKVVSAEFSCEMDGKLMLGLELDGREVVDDVTLATATYTAGLIPFDWSEMTVKLGTYASEASVNGVTSMSATFERPIRTDTRYAGGGGRKSEPTSNGRPMVTGTLEVDFLDKAVFLDRYLDGTAFSMIWEFVRGADIFRISLPYCMFDSSAPGLEGEEDVSHSMDFTAYRDDVNGRGLGTVTYITADAAA